MELGSRPVVFLHGTSDLEFLGSSTILSDVSCPIPPSLSFGSELNVVLHTQDGGRFTLPDPPRKRSPDGPSNFLGSHSLHGLKKLHFLLVLQDSFHGGYPTCNRSTSTYVSVQ